MESCETCSYHLGTELENLTCEAHHHIHDPRYQKCSKYEKTIGAILDDLPDFDKRLMVGVIAGLVSIKDYEKYYELKYRLEEKLEILKGDK